MKEVWDRRIAYGYWRGLEIGVISDATLEDVYQAFKARLMQELAVTSPELLERAILIDNTDEDQP